ncbi:MAG: glyoxylate/hydroxypyruvate reductase A [Proteobacteria bacterium]|nr:glyoxylate/hydroxypyruvate reductase A [Pseudomonadota bacterium]
MAIALIIGRDQLDQKRFDYFLQNIPQQLHQLQPNLDIRIYPEIGDCNDINFVIAWRAPLGIFQKFPKLQCIASLGAGVDHLLSDPHLPKSIPIVRIVDPAMRMEITQYVIATTLFFIKRFDVWADNQKQKYWNKSPPFNLLDKKVGIMGLGFLGNQAAETLHSLGIKVIGWSQSPKKIPGICCYHGSDQLKHFLAETTVLVCLLPLTPDTQNILNADLFSQLPQGAYLINLARGGHLVETDLLNALDSGKLSGVYLDVFNQEPLPSNHPFWTHPKIKITPHVAAVTNLSSALPQILDNYHRMLQGQNLLNLVNLQKGY